MHVSLLIIVFSIFMGFPGDSVVKNLLARAGDAGDTGSVPGSGRPPGGGNDNPFQSSCLGNTMDRGAWWTTVHSVAKSQTQLRTARYIPGVGLLDHTIGLFLVSLKETPYCSL